MTLLTFPFLAVLVLAIAAPLPAHAAPPGHWAGIAAEICTATGRAESLAVQGKTAEAKEAVVSAYFATFEDSRMEIAERSTLGAAHTADVEDMFNALRKAVAKPAGADLRGLASRLCSTLTTDGAALDAAKTEESR